jgi:hypothetical protein
MKRDQNSFSLCYVRTWKKKARVYKPGRKPSSKPNLLAP